MASFTGFTCDRCQNVVATEERTKRTVKFEGPTVEGQFTEDLCPPCAVEAVPDTLELQPLRRRRKSKSKGAAPKDEGQAGTTTSADSAA